jgi:hypothetical protein
MICTENVRMGSSQQVVTSEEAEQLINNGYIFVGVLPNGKVIVQK